MRPLRGLIACIGTLLLLTFILALRRSGSEHDGPAATEETRRSRLRALFTFRTPESFFPPSAIISLTDDNSTFFVARPAAYGPPLPSGGLSGQLWIGSGFGEDSTTAGRLIMNAEGELGCSDIPGWPYTGGMQEAGNTKGKETSKGKAASKLAADKQNPNAPVKSKPANVKARRTGKTSDGPQSKDGTDDHLHWPLKGVPLIKGAKIPEKQQDATKEVKDKEHGDIQSLQESAEIAGKVVLLSRGGCGFLEKTKWVQRRGGVALIVGNNIRDPSLVNMYAGEDTSNVTIPSVFTSHMSAHLLSSLLPPGGFLNGAAALDETTAKPAIAHNRKGRKRPAKGDTKSGSWLSRLAKALGIRSDGSVAPDHRYPNSGRISWIQSDNWDEEIAPKTTPKAKQAEVKGNSQNAKNAQGEKQEPEDFVIGIHDWRDKDLLALQQTQKQGARTKAASSSTTSTVTPDSKATGDAKAKSFAGGNVVPGSGRYSVPGQAVDNSKIPEKSEDTQTEQESSGWFGRIFSSEDEESASDDTEYLAADMPPPMPPLVDTPTPREGLWVTITPATISSSPFFDTLLVLVVSPLVTLTVVYALLLLRARIQRRRWRAPKSVVERLPVRVYHTMSSSSTSTSTHTPSVDASSATSPLLQPEHSSTLTRTRPRSHTTTSINETAALTLERQRGDLASRFEKKRYHGKQVECVVCLEEYVDGQSQVMCLPCGHEFHAECITPWLTTRRRTCPICKGDVVRSLTGGSDSGLSETTSHQARSLEALSPHSTPRSRSESRNSRRRLLVDRDLEGGQSAARSPLRLSWRSLATWWNRRSEGEVRENLDRNR